MNAPTPGWQPDPTGRHEYRYWDGSSWTDDVSDGGVASTDPMAGASPTAPMDTGQPYGTPAGGPGAPGYGYGSSSGQFPPAQPAKSGPSTGLLAGLAVAAVAVIALVVFLVTSSGDDDETSTDDTDTTEQSDDTSSDDTSDDAIVDAIAAGVASQSDLITDEQAQCVAQAMVDEVGLETLMEAGASDTDSGNPLENLTPEQQSAVFTAVTDCIPPDVLVEIGGEQGGG